MAPSKETLDVVVVGSCNIDLFAYVPRQPRLSETLHGHRFFQTYGGKGANQCVIAAKLGARTAMMGKVGKDTHGDQYRERLSGLGVNTAYLLQTSEDATGVALITVDDNGDNQIVICAGANLKYTPADVSSARDVISRARALVCQLEIPPESTLAALKLAHSMGVTTFFNPSPVSGPLKDEFFACTSVLVVNEGEAGVMAGMRVDGTEDAAKAAEILIGKGVKHAVVTLGGDGVVYWGEGMDVHVHIPTVKVEKVVDTAGAGDAFLGSLAFFYGMQIGMVEAIKRANQVAAITVQRCGTQSSYPDKAELPADLFQ